jgi:hypothetical protein
MSHPPVFGKNVHVANHRDVWILHHVALILVDVEKARTSGWLHRLDRCHLLLLLFMLPRGRLGLGGSTPWANSANGETTQISGMKWLARIAPNVCAEAPVLSMPTNQWMNLEVI